MIKVCHMTSVHPAEDVRIFHKECTSLAKAGYATYLVAQGRSYEKNGVNIVGVGQPSGGRLSRMTTFANKVYKAALALDADIYHFHDPELLPYGLKLKKKGKIVIFDSHEKYTEQLQKKPYLPHWSTVIISKVYGTYEEYALKRIDAVIFPCLKDGENPFEGLCERLALVNNVPIFDELYNEYDSKAIKNKNSICYVGGLTYSRGITHVIKAAFKANATVYLGGEFSPKEYEGELKLKPEYNCVKYMGRLDRCGVVDLLKKCEIGMATILNIGQYNKFDNFATKTYEYMSMAVPVIITSSNYAQKVMKKYEFGICVNPENIDEIADAIKYLLDNPDEAKRMGENGRRAVKEEFNWGVEEKKLLSLYEDILQN